MRQAGVGRLRAARRLSGRFTVVRERDIRTIPASSAEVALPSPDRQAWHIAPLHCPVRQKQMRVIAFIDHPDVVEEILRYLNPWCGPAAFAPARPPRGSDSGSPEPEFNIGHGVMPKCENVIND